MRDALVVLIVFGSVPLILARPFIGVLMWFWLSLMNPHRWTWGYAQQLRVALVIALATLGAWLFSRESKTPPNVPITYVLAAFALWTSIAALCAIHPEIAVPKWEEIIKIIGMTFVTTCIVRSSERIHQLVWAIVISIGVYGIKGGVFAILTGGHYRIYGPEETFIEDNNSLALALIMILPLMQYLRVYTASRWIRLGLVTSMGLTIVSILISYSRGALVGLTLTLAYFWLKSRHRVTVMLVTGGVLLAALPLLPSAWFDRMNTIERYDEDASALGRFDAWLFAYRLALDHPFVGGGQLIGMDGNLFMKYVPTATVNRAAHSIYFEVLGETGFVGLGLFLLLLATAGWTARNVLASTRDHPQLAWARSLAAMIQVSLVGYAVTGAFLSLGFFDLFYALIAVLAVTQAVVRQELAARVGKKRNQLTLTSTELTRPSPA